MCFTSVSISVSGWGEGRGAKSGCFENFLLYFLLYFYLKINFIHHPQCHFNVIQAKWLCTGIYFSTLGHNYIVLIAITVFVDAVQLL